jgi:hypothetical protein
LIAFRARACQALRRGTIVCCQNVWGNNDSADHRSADRRGSRSDDGVHRRRLRVFQRRRFAAATWSSVWYLLAAFAVISYTSNWAYVLFAALGSWIGGFLSITALDRVHPLRRE